MGEQKLTEEESGKGIVIMTNHEVTRVWATANMEGITQILQNTSKNELIKLSNNFSAYQEMTLKFEARERKSGES